MIKSFKSKETEKVFSGTFSKKLPQEKEEKLKTLKERCDQISEELEKMTDEINKIQEHLRDLKAIGKVKVEGDVYAGVKIYIRDVLDEVKIEEE